jgi:uncharacterized protein (UPF0332 family)
MMDARDFLEVAWDLVGGAREAEWRTAVSRAYYAAFHTARDLLTECGFTAPQAEQAHAYLWLPLANCGHPDVQSAGVKLNFLRQIRNRADYDIQRALDQATATDPLHRAAEIVQVLDSLATMPEVKTRIIDAIKVYERDVLRQVTWRP